jgi:hypothetical protein
MVLIVACQAEGASFLSNAFFFGGGPSFFAFVISEPAPFLHARWRMAIPIFVGRQISVSSALGIRFAGL